MRFLRVLANTRGVYTRLYCNAASGGGLKSESIFGKFNEVISAQPSLSSQVNAMYLWKISKDGKEVGQWTLDLRSGKPGTIYKGDPKEGNANCTVSVADDDLAAMADGSLDAQKAFMSGKMKVSGNVMLMMKLRTLFKPPSKL